MAALRQAVEDRRAYLLYELLRHKKYYRPSDEEWLSNVSLAELERLHINVKCETGGQMKCSREWEWEL